MIGPVLSGPVTFFVIRAACSFLADHFRNVKLSGERKEWHHPCMEIGGRFICQVVACENKKTGYVAQNQNVQVTSC